MIFDKKVLLPTVTALTFAGSFVAAKYATSELPPLTITFLRYIVAFIFLTGLLPYYKSSSLKVAGKDIIPLILLGLFGIVGYHFFFFTSLKYTAVANTAIINATSPVITGIIAAIFIGERMRAANYAGIIVALTGVMILLTKGNMGYLFGLNFNLGDILMICAVVCWAVYAILVQRLSGKYGSYTITYYAALFGVIQLLVLALIKDDLRLVASISLKSILSILYMGIIASGIGYFLYNMSIRRIGPTRTSSFVHSFVPVFVTVLGYIFFSEAVTAIIVISALLILVGLHLTLRDKSASRP